MTESTQFFYSLTPIKALELVEEFSVRCTGRILPLNSMENRVYEVEIEVPEAEVKKPSDRFRVAKFYRPGRWTKEQILAEHSFLFSLNALDIPVVPPLRTQNGDSLIELKNGEIYLALFNKSGGRIEPELNDEQLTRIGRVLARVHDVGASQPAKSRLVLNSETYGTRNIQYLKDNSLISPSVVDRYVSVASQIADLAAPLLDNQAKIRIHGDCHTGNVLWDSSGPKLVDFDDMLTGPPVQDLWLLLPDRGDRGREALQVLLNAYETLRPFDRSSLRLIELLRGLRMIHFAAWIARRFEDPSFKNAFDFFGSERYWFEQTQALEEIVSNFHNDPNCWIFS